MIHINDKHECCGCSACAQRCPKQCISMKEDGEGFLYPFVNPKNCTKCGVCEKVCPVLNQADERKPLECYAAVNLSDTIRLKSSSGGVFYPIAERIIRDGGVVFGARFNDNWEVIHAPAESLVDLKTFQGSKYVQSSTLKGATPQHNLEFFDSNIVNSFAVYYFDQAFAGFHAERSLVVGHCRNLGNVT